MPEHVQGRHRRDTPGGKVFVQPNGDATFVSTNGGKVFLGGKVSETW